MKKSLLTTVIIASMGLTAAHAKTKIELQRFFGACDAEYGKVTDVSKAVGECGIITTLINKFEEENPDIEVSVTTVEWPGYDQLNAQMASRSAPDIVSMHYSVISDYQSRGLLMPIDDVLAAQNIDKSRFTEAARSAVTKGEQIYALPFDNWTMLYHVNLNLMKEAGLVNPDGTPILPKSAEEFLAQAHQFKKATGKPYLVQNLANETALYMRTFYTFLMQQNSDFFADPKKINITTAEAKKALEFMKRIVDEGLSTTGMDYPASVSGFSNGAGAIALNGTWLIGDYYAQSQRENHALSGGYAVYPVSQLFEGKNSFFVDGHSWALPKKKHKKSQVEAIGKLFTFLIENNYEWARTGHLPAIEDVFATSEFQNLPFRSHLAIIREVGMSLPEDVQRQFALQDIIGEEVSSAVLGDKSIDEALETAQKRVNELLGNL